MADAQQLAGSCDASSPVAAAIMPLSEKMRRGRRHHLVAMRRRRHFRQTTLEFGLNLDSE
jgi:hypothetical protein